MADPTPAGFEPDPTDFEPDAVAATSDAPAGFEPDAPAPAGPQMSVGEPAKIEPAPPSMLDVFNPIKGLEKLSKMKAPQVAKGAVQAARQYAEPNGPSTARRITELGNPVDQVIAVGNALTGSNVPTQTEIVGDIASNTLGRIWPYVQKSVVKPSFEMLAKARNPLDANLGLPVEGTPSNPTEAARKDPVSLLTADALSGLGGDELTDGREAGRAALEKAAGPYGAIAAEFAAKQVGTAPLLFIPDVGAIRAEGILAEAANAAKLNFMFGAASRQDPYMSAATGFALGGTMHMVAKLPSSIVRQFNAGETQALREQIFNAVAQHHDSGLVASQVARKRSVSPAILYKDARPKGDPLAAGIGALPDGTVKLTEVWAKYDPERQAIVVHPVDTLNPTPTHLKFAQERYGWQMDPNVSESWPAMTAAYPDALDNTGAPAPTGVPADAPVAVLASPEEEAPVSPPRPSAPAVAASPRAAARMAARGGADSAVVDLVANQDVPTAEEAGAAVSPLGGRTVLTVRPTGELELQPMDSHPEVRPPSSPAIGAGDVVTLKHAGGDVPSVRVLGVKGDTARVLLPGDARAVEWPLSGLHLGSPAEEAAHFSAASATPESNATPDLATITDEVRRMGYVTPERLRARFPMLSDEGSAALIGDLQVEGVLRPRTPTRDLVVGRTGRGVYEATNPIEAAPGVKPGFKMYYGPAGSLQAGVYRGANVFKPGEHEIETQEPGGPIKTISIPASEFNTARPITLGRKDLANVPAQEGITSPLPPGVVAPQSEITKALAGTWTKVGTQLRGSASFLQDAVRHVFLNDVWSGPAPLWSARARVAVASKNYEAHVQAVTRTLRDVGLNTPADLELRGVLETQSGKARDAALADWVKKYPAEAADVKLSVKQLIDEAKMLEDQIRQLDPTGSIARHEAARAMGQEGEYVRGLYNAHIMARGNWAKWVEKQQPGVWRDASKLLVDEMMAQGFKGDLAAKASETMAEMLKTDPAQALSNAGLSSKTAKTWTQRETMPPEIRALLGENQSGVLGLAHTVATLRTQRAELAAWNDVASSMWWSRGPRQDLPVRVPPDARYGKAAGGYISRDLGWMVNAHKAPEQGMALANALGRLWKGNVTVFGGPGTWINNVMRNYPSAVFSGALDPAAPGEYHDAVREMAGLMLSYRKNPSAFGPAGILTEMQEFGALSPGMMSVEGSKFRGATERKVLASLQQNKGGLADGVVDFVTSLKHGSEAVDSVKEAYDAIDQIAKGSAYLVLRRRFLSQGMNVHDAAALSSLRVNQSFPNFSLPSPLARKMAANFGYAAPFATSKLEDLRIQGTVVARLGKGEPELWGNMAKAGMVGAGFATWIAALRKANGITDEDVKKAYAQIPLSTRGFKPSLVAMPSLDANGHVHFVDLSGYFDPLMASRGSQLDPLYQRLALGTVSDMFGQGAFTTPINMVAGSVGFAPNTARQTLDQTSRGLPVRGDEGIKTLMAGACAMGMCPQFPVRLSSALQQGGVTSSQPPTFTNQEMLAKMLGIPVVPSGPNQERIRNMQLKRGVKDIQGDMVKGALQNKDNPEARQELLGKQRGMIRDLVKTTRGEE